VLSLRLSSQLLLTFTRPSLTFSSTRFESGSAIVPIPVRGHRTSRIIAMHKSLFPLRPEFHSGATTQEMRSTSTGNEQEVPPRFSAHSLRRSVKTRYSGEIPPTQSFSGRGDEMHRETGP